MDLASFTGLYRTKTDEELIELAAQEDELTCEARSALTAELAIRRIEAGGGQEAAVPERSLRDDGLASGNLSVRAFVEGVLRFYGRSRGLFMRIIAPAILLGYVAVRLAGYEIFLIAQTVYKNYGTPSRLALLEISVISAAGYCVSWLLFCFSFAAICSSAEQIQAGFEASISESFSAVRERLWPMLRVSTFLLALFVVLELTFLVFPLAVIARPSGYYLYPISSSTLTVLSLALWAPSLLLLSRFSLAIPAVVLDDHPATRAMMMSWNFTRGKLPILAVLLVKGILGGYVAAMLPFWLARWIPPSTHLPPFFHWVLVAASLAAVTPIEPIMFIGFALLYLSVADAPKTLAAQAAAT